MSRHRASSSLAVVLVVVLTITGSMAIVTHVGDKKLNPGGQLNPGTNGVVPAEGAGAGKAHDKPANPPPDPVPTPNKPADKPAEGVAARPDSPPTPNPAPDPTPLPVDHGADAGKKPNPPPDPVPLPAGGKAKLTGSVSATKSVAAPAAAPGDAPAPGGSGSTVPKPSSLSASVTATSTSTSTPTSTTAAATPAATSATAPAAAADGTGSVANAGSDTTNKATEEPVSHKIFKSASDTRHYRRVTLNNGLDVLLVSDATSTKAAASMHINGIGYWSDPEDIAGLAHFLEHMLFLGTTRFPQEDAYSEFLSSHGGSSNAYTSMQATNYYFDVQPESFYDALDRFSQFFISPLFTESGTGREVQAVESEHVKNLQSDNWRTFMLLQSLSNPAHPFHKFGTGSTRTLGKIDKQRLRSELIAFWKKHYLAHNMKLVVLSHHPLLEMEQRVRTTFADLPALNGSAITPSSFPLHDEHNIVFPPSRTGKIVYSELVKDEREVSAVWFLPPQTRNYKLKAIEYISQMLGQEGKGSLLSLLRNEGLVTGLTAGVDLSTGSFDVYQVSFDLTVKGMEPENRRRVITKMFDYIRLVEKHGVEKWRWEEMAALSSIAFRHKNKEPAQSYVSDLSADMPKYDNSDVLRAAFQYDEYSPTLIHELLAQMTPERAIVMVSGKTVPGATFSQQEAVYGTRYSMSDMPAADLGIWRAARHNPDPATTGPAAQFSLPPRNEYIPTEFSLKYNPDEVSDEQRLGWPRVVHETPLNATRALRIWHKQDMNFKRPRANLVCKVWSQRLYATPRDVVISSLYSKLVRDALSELTYPAEQAGYDFSMTSDVNGMDIHLSGYDSGLKRLAGDVAKFLHIGKDGGFEPKQARFDVLKEDLGNSYANFRFSPPNVHAAYEVSMLLEEPHWHIREYQAILKHVQLADVLSWSRSLWDDVSVECLSHGNLREAESIDLARTVVSKLDYQSVTMRSFNASQQAQRIVELDGTYSFTMDTPNENDLNSAVYAHWQANIGGVKQDVMTQLLAMMMEKPCFHQLRTVEQLGYIVWSGGDVREGVNGIRVIVQSSKKDAAYLDGRVTEFMKKMRAIIHGMKKEQFSTFVDAIVGAKKQKPRTLAEETSKHWTEITNQQYLFDRRFREMDVARNITQADINDYFDLLVGSIGEDTASACTPQPASPCDNDGDSSSVSKPKRVAGKVSVLVTTQKKGAQPQTPKESQDSGSEYGGSAPSEYGGSTPQHEYGASVPAASATNDAQQQNTPATFIELHAVSAAAEEHLARVEVIQCDGSSSDDSRCACQDHNSAQDCNGYKVASVVKPVTANVVKPITIGATSSTSPPTSSSSSSSSPSSSSCECEEKYTVPCECARIKCGCEPTQDNCSCFKPKPVVVLSQKTAGDSRRVHEPIAIASGTWEAFKSTLQLFPKRPVLAVDVARPAPISKPASASNTATSGGASATATAAAVSASASTSATTSTSTSASTGGTGTSSTATTTTPSTTANSANSVATAVGPILG